MKSTLRTLLAALPVLASTACTAGSLRYCDAPTTYSAAEQDKLLRFGALIRAELERSGSRLALISRSGLDLRRFGVRYSHAGISLKASPNTPWSVRQLYYACDEQRPRLFDQGLSGFLMGFDDPRSSYVSVVFLPASEAESLERTALDNRQALALLGTTYSANAYAFSDLYQNCNQWVMELLATAWSGESGGPASNGPGATGHPEGAGHPAQAAAASASPATPAANAPGAARRHAQQWLAAQRYEPTSFDMRTPFLTWLGAFVPWVHSDDHPPATEQGWRYRVSMPASIEGFIRQSHPTATRVEFCRVGATAVVRRGWVPFQSDCEAEAGDEVIALD